MATATKPIRIFSHAGGPNPWRVILLCIELGLPYEDTYPDLTKLHTPEYEQYNPNGRTPTIIDPNTGITLWESGAIIQYLIKTYDTTNRFSFPAGSTEQFHADQWLFFQATGQGPYFGQFAWFTVYHPEKVQSAMDRYKNEIKRVTKVLDGVLEGKQYLVGDKCTYADLAFIAWYWVTDAFGMKEELEGENAHFKAWITRLNERPAVKRAFEARREIMAKNRH